LRFVLCAWLFPMSSAQNTHWYAVHVKSRHEFAVRDRLMGAGVETFLPSMERRSKWKDRNKFIQFPLFSGYLFVHIEKSSVSRIAVLKTKGVVRMLGNLPGEPEPVPEEQVLSLKKVIEAGTLMDPYPYLHEGQKVRIKRGPLSGVEGILVEKSGLHRLVLSVDIICQSTAVTIQAWDVEPL
jgi:transcriptional antiterminator NusG